MQSLASIDPRLCAGVSTALGLTPRARGTARQPGAEPGPVPARRAVARRRPDVGVIVDETTPGVLVTSLQSRLHEAKTVPLLIARPAG